MPAYPELTKDARIAITTVGLDPMSQRALTHFLLGVPGAAVAVNLDSYSGAEWEVGRAGDQALTRICFIDWDQNSEQAIWTTERLRSDHPEIHVFAVSGYAEPERIITAMRAGCAEYLMKPVQNERVLEGLARVEAKQKERTRSKIRGRVVTLIGAKGGTGVTSLALHLALELTAQGQQKCLLVDQHPALGDASLYLGAGRRQYSFYELASNADRLDQELLQGFLLRHPSGLHLLDSPEAVDGAHSAPTSAVEHTLAFLADIYQFVVVDCPPGLTDGTLACLAQSDHIAIVMTAELPSVRNVIRYTEHLTRLGHDPNRIQIVLNRHSKRGPLTDERIEKALGRQISLRVPNCYHEVIRAINAGAPIESDKSDFCAAIQSWAQTLVHKPAEEKPRAAAAAGEPRGMLSLLRK